MPDLPKSGLYIVTLKNSHPISVNANDIRIADRAIKVTSDNCKFGKAKVLAVRKRNYEKTFGHEHVNFKPLVLLENIKEAEAIILKELDEYRVRGRTGLKNEWLAGIAPEQVESIVFRCLDRWGISYYSLKQG